MPEVHEHCKAEPQSICFSEGRVTHSNNPRGMEKSQKRGPGCGSWDQTEICFAWASTYIPWAARLCQAVMNSSSFLGFQFSGVGKRQGKALAMVAPFCHAHSKPSGWCKYSMQLRHEFAKHSASPSSYQFWIKLEITSTKNLMEECYWQQLRFFSPRWAF